MARYARRPTTWIEDETFGDDYPLLPDLTVSDAIEVDTGLVWDDGTPIYRPPPPIGFGRDSEW